MSVDVASGRLRLSGRPRIGAEVDEAVVERLLSGDVTVTPNWLELDAAMVRLEPASAVSIAHRLRICNDTVHRHRARRRELQEG